MASQSHPSNLGTAVLTRQAVQLCKTFVENLRITGKLTFPAENQAYDRSLTDERDTHKALLKIVNDQLCKSIKEYTDSRKLVEAQMDTYDYFFTRAIEFSEGINLPFSFVSWESVGSRSEGLKSLANDTDILMTSTTLCACFPSPNANVTEHTLVIETNACHPGYCRLKFHEENRQYTPSRYPGFTQNLDGDIYFCNTMNATFLHDPDIDTSTESLLFTHSVHGPALTNEDLRHDYVNAIRCTQPHNLLDAYMSRERTWPDASVLSSLRDIQCTVVTAGHAKSINPSIEFRISFASHEKFLIRNVSSTQFACYGFLKIIKRRMERDDPTLEDVIRSYYIKTAFLWICETLESVLWTDQYFLQCISICLLYLRHCLHIRILPQLFQPENNLIDHMTPEECDQITAALEKYIPPVNARMFLRSWCDDTFDFQFEKMFSRSRRFLHRDIHDLLVKTSTSKFGINHIATLLEADILSFCLFGSGATADGAICQVLYQMIIRDVDNIVSSDMAPCIKSLLYRLLAGMMHRQPRFVRNNNKLAEEFYRKGIPMIYPISLFDDKGLSGNTNLAFFHYLNGDYADALKIFCEMESVLYEADLKCALSMHLVYEDIPRMWRDAFLIRLVETFSVNLHSVLVKCNVFAFYMFTKCIDELYSANANFCPQKARLRKIKRSVRLSEQQLSMLETDPQVYNALLIDAVRTIMKDLEARMTQTLEAG